MKERFYNEKSPIYNYEKYKAYYKR